MPKFTIRKLGEDEKVDIESGAEVPPVDFALSETSNADIIPRIAKNYKRFIDEIFLLLLGARPHGPIAGRLQQACENMAGTLQEAQRMAGASLGQVVLAQKLEGTIRLKAFSVLDGLPAEAEGYEDPLLCAKQELIESVLTMARECMADSPYLGVAGEITGRDPIEASVRSLVDELFHGSLAERLWIPTLDPAKSQVRDYNRDSVRNAFELVDQHLETPEQVGRYFELTDESGKRWEITMTQSVVEKMKLLYRVSSEQPNASRPGSVVEVFSFYVGTQEGDNRVNITDLHIPLFRYQGDTVTFTAAPPQLEEGQKIIGTHHSHPGGSEWACLSDLDLTGGVITYFEGDMGPKGQVLFHSVQSQSAVSIFPFHPEKYQQYVAQASEGGFGISPFEPLRKERVPYMDFA